MIVLILLGCTSLGVNSHCDTGSVTWDNWGHGFFLTWCASCHSSTAINRNGAPETSVFDTTEQVLDWKERIQIRVVEERSMPVGGGIPQAELDLLVDFLETLEHCENTP